MCLHSSRSLAPAFSRHLLSVEPTSRHPSQCAWTPLPKHIYLDANFPAFKQDRTSLQSVPMSVRLWRLLQQAPTLEAVLLWAKETPLEANGPTGQAATRWWNRPSTSPPQNQPTSINKNPGRRKDAFFFTGRPVSIRHQANRDNVVFCACSTSFQ